ncbi:MAG: hypothetical protein RL632_152 [Bacteroidota bacterium]|jgi:hypothetical protein
MNLEISAYISKFDPEYQQICSVLEAEINKELTEAEHKIWHAHPVWFLDGNPIVGYSKQKPGIRLMFWSGADFEENGLIVREGKFKDASIFYNSISEIDVEALNRWLKKSRDIQWDYKNIVKNRGKLNRIQ